MESPYIRDRIPQKRCDVCLIRRAKLKMPKVETVKKLHAKISTLEKRIERKEKRGKNTVSERRKVTRFRESIVSIIDMGYAMLCAICAREPRIIVVKYVSDKVYEVPDSLCMDCAVMFNYVCRFLKEAESDKEQRRRDRLYKEWGKFLLCV